MDRLLLITDPRLSRDTVQELERAVQATPGCTVHAIHVGNDTATPERVILQAIQDLQPRMVLLPTQMYFQPSSLRNQLLGLRAKGPITLTYWADPQHTPWLRPEVAGQERDHDKDIWIDATQLKRASNKALLTATLQALRDPDAQSGIRPLAGPSTSLKWQTRLTPPTPSLAEWLESSRAQIAAGTFKDLWPRMRMALLGVYFWQDLSMPTLGQFEINGDLLWMRFVGRGPFWPRLRCAQEGDWSSYLRGAATWIRMQSLPKKNGLCELTLALPIDPSLSTSRLGHPTLILGTLGQGLLQKEDMPDQNPATSFLHAASEKTPSPLEEAQARIRILETTLKEMRRGGVGSAPPMPAPDLESLLDVAADIFASLEAHEQADFLQRLWRRKKGSAAA